MCHKLYLGHRPITSYDLSYRDMLPGALRLRSRSVLVYGGNISSRVLEVSARVLKAICFALFISCETQVVMSDL